MHSVIYIIPYFGKLRSDFPLWLESCKMNPTINWLLITDDKHNENLKKVPENVKIKIMTFNQLKKKIQGYFDFTISLDAAYKLCDYKPAFGEIFEDDIKEYDFWGHCDMDLIFGNIRKYLTEEIFESYDRIGRWGHSILYRNTTVNNRRYRTCIENIENYITVLSSPRNYFFDEMGMLNIFNALNIPTFCKLNIADIHPSYWRLEVISNEPRIRKGNRHRIFHWANGNLISYSVVGDKIEKDEFMYIHFLRRPMKLENCSGNIRELLIVPNTIKNVSSFSPDKDYIISASKNRMDKYWISLIQRKWRVATPQKIYIYFSGRMRGFYRKIFKNGQ